MPRKTYGVAGHEFDSIPIGGSRSSRMYTRAINGTIGDWIRVRDRLKKSERPDLVAWLADKRSLRTGESIIHLLDLKDAKYTGAAGAAGPAGPS